MKKLYQKFLYVPKHAKVPEKVFLTRTVLSAATILLCMVCLCSATFAYFSDSVFARSAAIETANYGLTIVDGSGAAVTETYVCSGADDHTYTFTLTATGTASTGYGKVVAGGEVYYTAQIAPGENMTLYVKAAPDTEVSFVACWGTSSASVSGTAYGNDETIVCANAENLIDMPVENDQYILHTVLEGETLESIAAIYGMAVETICEYNDISLDYVLTVGEQIAIPKAAMEEPSEEIEEITEEEEYIIHIVAENETLADIAQLYKTSVEAICRLNDLRPDVELTVGQELKIPKETAEEPTEPMTEPSEPVTEPSEPATEPSEPVTDPTEPATEPSEPVTEPSEPATEPSEPVTEPSEPATEPSEPVTEPSEPATEPSEPVTEPLAPATEPSEPVTEPSEPATEPSVPITEPSEPATESP